MNLIPNYKNLSDQDLLSLLRESDHAAYTEIYSRYFYLLYTHAYKKLRDEDQAKDIIQDIFAALWFRREFDLNTSNLTGYLFRAVRNRIFDLFAHEQVKSKYFSSVNDYLETHTATPTDYLLRENDFKAYIGRAIQALPPKMKLIFEMSRNEHLSHKEIAEKLGTTENNVSTQITSALHVLRTKLNIFIMVLLVFIFH